MIGAESSRSKTLLSGWSKVSTTRCGLLVSYPVIAAAVRLNCGVHGPAVYAFSELSTSAEVKARPSW